MRVIRRRLRLTWCVVSDDLKFGTFVHVPRGFAALIYPVPVAEVDDRDDATKILDAFTPRGAGPHVTHLLDEGEDG